MGSSRDSEGKPRALGGGEEIGVLDLEAWIQGLIAEGKFTNRTCLEVLQAVVGELPVAKRPVLHGQGRAVLCGLYAVGGFRGVSVFTDKFPRVVEFLNRFFRSRVPDGVWTTLYVSHNTRMPIHRDLRNALGFPVLVQAVGEFKGGGLWLEDEFGPSCRTLPDGSKRPGRVHDLREKPIVFSGSDWHESEDWDGDRWVISAFVPRDYKAALAGNEERLEQLGFPVPVINLEEVAAAACKAEDGPDEGQREELWELEIPSPVVGEGAYEDWVWEHARVARLCSVLVDEICDWVGDPDGISEVAGQLRQEEARRDYLECLLGDCRTFEDQLGSIRALEVEIPLAEHPMTGGEQFLQTRNVSLLEARQELSKWKEPATEEVVSLEQTNRAVDRVLASEVDKWASEGISVVQLPGKAVLTRKAGTGKRRCRAVCCGNYLPTEKLGFTREELYASGAEALSVKVAITFAARYPEWTGVTIDVKSAFLYAPIRTENRGAEERIVVKPPHFLVELGVLSSDDRWWIKKALYGLPTSPRDWGRYRDAEFRQLRITHEGQSYQLKQLKSDDALWLVRRVTEEGLAEVAGILVVYVDDLAFFATVSVVSRFINELRTLWKTSEPEWLGESAVTFCGLEIFRTPDGYRLAQGAYIQELLQRFNVSEDAAVPVAKWVDPEVPEVVTPEEIKEAQSITGALLWIATRTRPDISYVVSRCGQQATKAPQVSISLGLQTLRYLRSTREFGIEIPFVVNSLFSSHGQLSMPRTDRVIELYSDASHSPNGGRSMQSVFLVWRSVPLAWEAGRQAFTTLSSAEAELVSMVYGVQLSESLQPLIDELIEEDSVVSLLGDNEAAIRAFDSVSASWRNRHLRMRAVAGRERIEAGLLRVSHLSGDFQVADLGTKPLPRSRIIQLLNLINIREPLGAESQRASARVLSRGFSGVKNTATPELLAGLALLTLLPRVNGQPEGAEIQQGADWLHWVVAGLVTVLCVVFSRAVLSGVDELWEQVFSFDGVEVGGTLEAVSSAVDGTELLAQDEQAEAEVESDASSVFNEREWEEASAKLREAERASGLTFVQRARLRRQLAAGDIVEVPTFLQRYGPTPPWLTSLEPGDFHFDGRGSEVPLRAREAWVAEALLEGLRVHSDRLAFLGMQASVWRCIRTTAWSFRRSAALTLLEHWSNPGVPRVPDVIPEGEVEFRLEGLGWVPGALGIGEDPASGVSSESLSGVSGPVQRSSPHRNQAGVSSESLSGVSGPVQRSSQHGNQAGVSSESLSGVSRSGLDGVPDTRPRVQIGGSSGSRDLPPRVQIGGSSSSSDPVQQRVPRAQEGGSSSSHGMTGEPWGAEQGFYEDLFGPAMLDTWPLVGTWLRIHYLAQIFSWQGERVLWMLGERSSSWFVLRGASSGIRCALAGAIVDVLRAGPQHLYFSTPQWMSAVDNYILTGYPFLQLSEETGFSGDAAVTENSQVFPYILWPPPYRAHYLWRLLAEVGCELLMLISSRAREFFCLRQVATGFRTYSVYAMILWLRRTGIQRMSDGPQSWRAAETYIQSGNRVYPFEEPEDRVDGAVIDGVPLRPVNPVPLVRVGYGGMAAERLEQSSSSSGEVQSTTEPSVTSVGAGDSLESEVDASGQGFGEAVVPPGRPEAVLHYEVGQESLIVVYAGGSFQVPLVGWGSDAVEAVVSGLNAGVWENLEQCLTQIPAEPTTVAQGPEAGLQRVFQGFGLGRWFLWFVVWWAIVQSVGAQEAEFSGDLVSLGARPLLTCTSVLDPNSAKPRDVDVSVKESCDGSTLWELLKLCCAIGAWEVWKLCVRNCRRKTAAVDCGAQTSDRGFIPMPLPIGVRHRDRILFELWRAGYTVDVEECDQETQDGFHWLLGDYLSRVERASEGTDSS